jgi:peptidylprolyl isomerase
MTASRWPAQPSIGEASRPAELGWWGLTVALAVLIEVLVLRSRVLSAFLVVPAALLAGCGSSSKAGQPAGTGSSAGASSSAASSAAASSVTTAAGVKVEGGFGAKPTVTIPNKAAPATLLKQVITPGTGPVVAKGDTLVANYSGQTWAPKSGKPHVFDSSFDRGAPAAFVIGVGAVVPGWDKTLVGQHVGSRLLISLPPAEGYGASGQPDAGITGTDTLVFVVDLVSTYKPNASAPGTAVANLPTAGLPKITNPVGKAPTVVSTAGVKAPAKPTSTLLISGTGAKIDPSKTLVLQVVQTDLATGKKTQSTWGRAPQTVSAQNVLSVATVLSGAKIGSRAEVLVPNIAGAPASASSAAQPPTPPQLLIVDVVGEF